MKITDSKAVHSGQPFEYKVYAYAGGYWYAHHNTFDETTARHLREQVLHTGEINPAYWNKTNVDLYSQIRQNDSIRRRISG